MPIRPVDVDQLWNVCRSIAERNSGFLYVSQVDDEIRTEYESKDKSVLKASKLNMSAIDETLQDLAQEDVRTIERLRAGVYYFDPFASGSDTELVNRLRALFDKLVVTKDDVRTQFDLAMDDVDFFVSELEERGLIQRIAAGTREYYTIGQMLKDDHGEQGLSEKLFEKSTNGKISHRDLEEAISVSAIQDVISYLAREGFIVDLDGEYLVKSDEAIDEFGAWLAGEVEERVEKEFEEAGYAMPTSEYERVVEEAVKSRSSVLQQARSERDRILSAVESALASDSEPAFVPEGIVTVWREKFDEQVEAQATEIYRSVDTSIVGAPSEIVSDKEEDIESIQIATAPETNEVYQDRIRSRVEEKIRSET